ncbi:hypothetical protein PG997_013173 [Apiospora hydei]|uniref:C2H2-type domain-containing protein n=1 Tax=Apiospora hydei TaxID=1337664 RepID=A0ABR1V7Y9_9PEZI
MATSPTTPTPTKATFSQRPLPTSPFPQAVQIPESIDEKKVPQRENSQHSRKSRGDSEDVGMDDSDGEGHGDDGAGSDDDSINADGTKSNKKKKSQRFYCTDYPPCNLSFTRSEHLARHIRKHTGERPFQCHCSRRFSRLDNLRQHAQTVHVNEDIPIDSLAATGTRFQRQIRTDRVRQPGRARASTAGSMAGGPNRGHSKSLSTSSIGSIGSNLSSREDARRRPPPLVMADPRSRLSLESYHSAGGDSQYSYRAVSPSDFSTPTSATFSTGQSSPRWSGIASPTSSHSRSQSMYAGSRTPGRRLSVPSGGNPFQSPHVSNVADEAWRRRTWHPDSSNFNAANTSSRLSQVITPSQFQSPVTGPVTVANHPAPQNSAIRLPGIESFDPLPHRPTSPLRRNPSPMMIDSESSHPPALLPSGENTSESRRGTANWDMGLHRGLTRLDIASNTTPPRDGAGTWAQEVHQAVEAEADRVRLNPPTVRFNDNVIIENGQPGPSGGNRGFHQHTMSAPSFTHSREGKRHGWYNGPVIHNEGPPEKIARVERVGRMVHPNISHFAGFPARQPTMPQQPAPANGSTDKDNMLRLQALVAVATSETNATAAY